MLATTRSLKRYNVFHAALRYKFVLLLLLGISVLLYRVTYRIEHVAAFVIIFQILFVAYLTIDSRKDFSTVRAYINKHAIEIGKRYDVDSGFGYNLYFRSFSDQDIDTMLSSTVADEFTRGYIFPVKMRMVFLITVCCFILAAVG